MKSTILYLDHEKCQKRMFIFFSENAKIDTCSRQTYLLLQFSRKMQEILVITSSIASPETVLSNFSISIFLPNDSPSNLGFPESLEWIGPLAPRHLVADACVCVLNFFVCILDVICVYIKVPFYSGSIVRTFNNLFVSAQINIISTKCYLVCAHRNHSLPCCPL